MKATGIVRRIDDLGRIVVPKEIRRTLRIREGDALEIFTDREGENHSQKYSPLGEMGNFDRPICGKSGTDAWISGVYHRYRSGDCSRTGKKEFQEQLITRQLAEVIARREQFLASSWTIRKFTVIVSGQNAELKWQVVSPMILRRRCDRFCRDPGKGWQEKTGEVGTEDDTLRRPSRDADMEQ